MGKEAIGVVKSSLQRELIWPFKGFAKGQGVLLALPYTGLALGGAGQSAA